MSDPHKTLTDQVKEAEIAKLKVEKEKLDYELAQLKIPHKTNYKELLILIGALGSLLFLYIEYGFKPVLQVETRNAELNNAITGRKLFKLEGHLDTVSNYLLAKSIELDKRKREIDTLSKINDVEKENNLVLSQQNNKLNSEKEKVQNQIFILNNSVQNLKNEKQKLQPLVDSLQNIADIEEYKQWHNVALVVLRYQYKDEAHTPIDADIICHITPTKSFKIRAWHQDGVGEFFYNAFYDIDIEVILKSNKYKLQDPNFRFKIPSDIKSDGIIKIPVVDK